MTDVASNSVGPTAPADPKIEGPRFGKLEEAIERWRRFFNSHHQFETFSGRAPRDRWMEYRDITPDDIWDALMEQRESELKQQDPLLLDN
jgi:hypothetical protein